jgi:CelD/BcsL family acetyltransferase involved in cellulose biosynthesis
MAVRPLRGAASVGHAKAHGSETSSSAVRVVANAADFMALHAPWNAVAASNRNARVFLSHEWFDAAWQWRRQSARLYLLCLFDNQSLAAVLPLVLQETSRSGIRLRELSFLTVPDTQACDLIVAPANRATAARAFAHELERRQSEWDVVRLNYLAPDSVAAGPFRAALADAGFAAHVQGVAGNLFIALDSTWEAYYATRSRRLKKANNLAANRLGKAGDVRIDHLAPGTGDSVDLERFVDRSIDVSGRSWKTRTGNSLDNPAPQAFIRRLSHLAHERKWLSIWTLCVNDRPVAMEYQLAADGCVYALRSDFDAQFEEVSPGTYLNRYLLQRLFGAAINRYYMGPGDNAYKHRWTEQAEPVEELTVYGRSLSGRCLATWETTLKPAARRLRDRIQRAPLREPEDVGD